MNHDSTAESEGIIQVIADLAIGEDDDGRVCRWNAEQENAEQFTARIAANLRHSRIVFVPDGGARTGWADKLLLEEPLRQIVAKGYSKLIVLDVAAGLDENNIFQLSAFYRYAFAQIVTAFGVEPGAAYHEEDVAQFLRDETGLCLCIVNAHLAPSTERKRLRCLTQEGHASLVVFRESIADRGVVRQAASLDEASPPAIPESEPNIQSNFLVIQLNSHISQHPINCPAVTLGRHPDCDIVLEHLAVGRRHAELTKLNGVWHLRDLGSRNGTYLGGKAIASDNPTPIDFGVSFAICDYQCSLHWEKVDLDAAQVSDSPPKTEPLNPPISMPPDLEAQMYEKWLQEVSDDFDDCGSVSVYDLIRRAEQDRSNTTSQDRPPPKPMSEASKDAAAEVLKKFFNRK